MADSPARFGEYLVEAHLYRGASADVFRVTHEGLGGFRRTYAVKAIRPDRAGEPDLVAQFEEEARIGGKLSHGNIVQVREPGRTLSQVYIVKEFVPGATLAAVLANRPGSGLGTQPALTVAIEILKALEYAHTRKVRQGNRTIDLVVPHCDLSPANVLLSLQGEVKLTNFGVPASPDANPSHAAPEVLRGEPCTPHSDLFSCGVVLYEMLTGHHPFARPTTARSRDAAMGAEATPVRDHAPALPTALVDVVERSLRRHPGQRLSSATAMKESLVAVLSDLSLVPDPESLSAAVAAVARPSGGAPPRQPLGPEDKTDGFLGPAPPLRPRPDPLAPSSPGARLLQNLGAAAPRTTAETDATEIRRRPPPPVPPLAQPEDWNNAPTRLRSQADLDSGEVHLPPPQAQPPSTPRAARRPPSPVRPAPPVVESVSVSPRRPAVRHQPPLNSLEAASTATGGTRWLWVVSGGAVALLVMMVGFFLGARTASLRAAQHAGSFTLTTPGTAAWHVDGETVAPESMPDGGTSLVLSAGEKEVLAETPDGARLRVQVGPAGVQQISLERTETEKSP